MAESPVVLALDLGNAGAAVLGTATRAVQGVHVLDAFRWTGWAHEPRAFRMEAVGGGRKVRRPTDWADLEAFYATLREQNARWRARLGEMLAVAQPHYWGRELTFVTGPRGRGDLRHHTSIEVVRSQGALWGWMMAEVERQTEAVFLPVRPVDAMRAGLVWRNASFARPELAELGEGPAGEHVRDAAGVLDAVLYAASSRARRASALSAMGGR